MPRLPLLAALPALLLTATLTGCGDDPGSAEQGRDPVAGGDTTTATSDPTTSAPPAPASPSTEATPRRPRRSASPGSGDRPLPLQPRRQATTGPALREAAPHLLPAEALPGPAAGGWRLAAEGDEGDAPVGACQKTPLTTIGATATARRDHVGDGDARASQVVARFADRKSAWRAHQVLVAWHADCAERLAAEAEVSPVREVPVAAGSAGGYATEHARRGERTVSALGLVRRGRWLAVVEVSAPPRTWSDRDATRVAARAARRVARTFG